MDRRKVLEAISIYRKFFQDNGSGKIDFPHTVLVRFKWQVFAHCHGMLDKMQKFVAENRMDKVFRWLGFIQGCLWVTGAYTLEELKNHNRPDPPPAS